MDPQEGLTSNGMIRTGAALENVTDFFAPVHRGAVAMLPPADVALYAYGSVVTGQAVPVVSDVDLLTIGLSGSDTSVMAEVLSAQFKGQCRGVEIAAAMAEDFVGASDEAHGNRVFLRHYCVLLAGSDQHRPPSDFPGDARAARGFNGDLAIHVARWRQAIRSGADPIVIGRRAARKTLLAVAGLVSVHDRTWTTDRALAAHRWGTLYLALTGDLAELLAWSEQPPDLSAETVSKMLDGPIESIVHTFDQSIGMWR